MLLCRLPGLPDCIISAVWAVFFLAVGASLANWGTCAAGGGMTGANSMSRSMALMFGGGGLAGSTSSLNYANTANTYSMSNADLSQAVADANALLNQYAGAFGMRHLLYQGSSEAQRLVLGRKGAPAVADVSSVTRRQLLGSLGAVMMKPQVLCG
jgi:hypothetical protein